MANGVASVYAAEYDETFHPVIGPVAEAEALYVKQLRLVERVRDCPGDFVIWDVGLGAAANVLTVLRALSSHERTLKIVSFDCTLEPLRFGLQHADELGYFGGFEGPVQKLLREGRVTFSYGAARIDWNVHVADFPEFLGAEAGHLPRPHAILFDAFSPATNPAMWTQPLFARIHQLLDPQRPCALPTYSRSTMLRVALLLAGFYVGVGDATGEKEETTIAANSMSLIDEPLDRKWLERAHRSTSAEPLWTPEYRQARMSEETWARLKAHAQFG